MTVKPYEPKTLARSQPEPPSPTAQRAGPKPQNQMRKRIRMERTSAPRDHTEHVEVEDPTGLLSSAPAAIHAAAAAHSDLACRAGETRGAKTGRWPGGCARTPRRRDGDDGELDCWRLEQVSVVLVDWEQAHLPTPTHGPVWVNFKGLTREAHAQGGAHAHHLDFV